MTSDSPPRLPSSPTRHRSPPQPHNSSPEASATPPDLRSATRRRGAESVKPARLPDLGGGGDVRVSPERPSLPFPVQADWALPTQELMAAFWGEIWKRAEGRGSWAHRGQSVTDRKVHPGEKKCRRLQPSPASQDKQASSSFPLGTTILILIRNVGISHTHHCHYHCPPDTGVSVEFQNKSLGKLSSQNTRAEIGLMKSIAIQPHKLLGREALHDFQPALVAPSQSAEV